MELLTSPKFNYLLEAELDVLHEQSNEWLEEIAFWRDEVAFYYVFMIEKTDKRIIGADAAELDPLEKEIIDLSSDELNELEKLVQQHERFLNDLLENHPDNETTYRHEHSRLAMRMVQYEKRFKYLKKDIFSLYKMVKQK